MDAEENLVEPPPPPQYLFVSNQGENFYQNMNILVLVLWLLKGGKSRSSGRFHFIVEFFLLKYYDQYNQIVWKGHSFF